MKSRSLIIAFAIASVLLALIAIRRQLAPPAMNLRPSLAVGEVLAGEVARVLGGRGKVVVIGRGSARDGKNAGGEQISSFGAAMKRLGTLPIISTEWLPQPPAGTMDPGVVKTEQLLQLIEKHPEVDAFVIFAGLPPPSPPVSEKLSARPLKLLAVCGYGPHVRRWLETGALAVAVVPRFGELPPGTPAPQTVKDWFEREFEMLTPESVGRLPY
jgi:hypothetical protein